MGQGALLLGTPGGGRKSLLLMAPEWARLPLVLHRHRGDDHRQPGGDLGRLLGHPAGDPARLPAAPADRAHQREGGRADLHPGGQLGAAGDGHPAGPRLPATRPTSPSAYGIAVTGTMLIDDRACSRVLVFQVWKWNRLLGGADDRRCSSLVDGAYLRVQPHQDPRRRLVPAAGRRRSVFTLLTTWAKGRQLMRERLDEAALPLRDLHQVGRARRHRVPRHRGVHVQLGRRRARTRCCTISSTTRCFTSG